MHFKIQHRNDITRELTLCVLYSAWARDPWLLKCGTDLKVIQTGGVKLLLGDELRLFEEEKDSKEENEKLKVPYNAKYTLEMISNI